MDGINNLVDVSLSKLGEMLKDRGAWHAAVCGVAKSDKTDRLSSTNGCPLMTTKSTALLEKNKPF